MKFNKPIRTLSKALFATAAGLCLTACNAEDRSGEQPFAPTVENVDGIVEGDSCALTGRVTASPNSTLKSCGFAYGNDTLRLETKSEAPTTIFTVRTKPLQPGIYYAVAFAENGVGRGLAADTLYFEIR